MLKGVLRNGSDGVDDPLSLHSTATHQLEFREKTSVLFSHHMHCCLIIMGPGSPWHSVGLPVK